MTDRPSDRGTTQHGAGPTDEQRGVSAEVVDRLRRRGVSLDGRESDEELVTLLEAVEAFEHQVERRGGDLMVDEPVGDKVTQPDNSSFVLPRRTSHESASAYAARVRDAAASLKPV